MNQYEEKLKQYMEENNIQAEHLQFQQSCHSVEEAAQAANARAEDFVKSMCLLTPKKDLIVAIVSGSERVSLKKVAKNLNIQIPRIARPKEILDMTGYPVGGVPPFGYQAKFLIDEKIMEREAVYAGGGSNKALIKISPQEIKKVNKGKVVRIGK